VHLQTISILILASSLAEPTFPVNGTIWCSQRLNTSISFTITSSLCPSWNIAPFTISRTFSWYPFVKNNIAFAYLSGVPRSPSRSGSSPRHSRIVRTAPEIFCSRAAACSGVSSFRSRVPRPARYQTLPLPKGIRTYSACSSHRSQ
jgi:hypothetical protein